MSPKTQDTPKPSFSCCDNSMCFTLAGMESALSIKTKSHPHPIGFPKLSLTRSSFSYRTQNPPRRPRWMPASALQLTDLIVFRYQYGIIPSKAVSSWKNTSGDSCRGGGGAERTGRRKREHTGWLWSRRMRHINQFCQLYS